MPLSEFDLGYELAKEVNKHVMGDFVVLQCGTNINIVEPARWTLFFDGSSCGGGSGIGVVLVSPIGVKFEFSSPFEKPATNNQAEY